jgi:transposase-like protein
MNKNKSTSRKVPSTEPDNRVRGKKRLELIQLGLEEGKSRRRIAAELGVDEGTVRRDIRILLLPESSLTSILNGAPAEQHIRAAQREAAQNAKQQQLAAEREAGTKSMKQRIAEENISQCHRQCPGKTASSRAERQMGRWLCRTADR